MSGALLGRVRGNDSDESLWHILDAAVETFQKLGIRRATMGDVSMTARVGRATLYRRFPQKSDLVRAALLHELRRFLDDLDRRIVGAPTVRERLVEGFVGGVTGVREHPLLSRLLATEPNDVLPYITLDGGPIIAIATAYLAGHMREGVTAGELSIADVDETAEVMVRVAHSLVLTPSGADGERVRFIAHRLLDALLG
jgi:AcrR family transcriptional regulator